MFPVPYWTVAEAGAFLQVFLPSGIMFYSLSNFDFEVVAASSLKFRLRPNSRFSTNISVQCSFGQGHIHPP